MFSIIAAVGKNNELGKKTWESLPKKLPNRKNIVVSFEEIEGPDECITDLVQFIKDNENTNEEIFVIGGGSIYAQFIDHAKRIYLTEIDGEDSEADVFFPTFDKSKYKRTVLQKGNSGKLSYEMCRYEV